jgi:polygalacturonase
MDRKIVLAAVALLLISTLAATRFMTEKKSENWEIMNTILRNIREPEFNDKVFNIVDFGAKNDGSLSTAAIHKAIDACVKNGGGIVLFYRCNSPSK